MIGLTKTSTIRGWMLRVPILDDLEKHHVPNMNSESAPRMNA